MSRFYLIALLGLTFRSLPAKIKFRPMLKIPITFHGEVRRYF